MKILILTKSMTMLRYIYLAKLLNENPDSDQVHDSANLARLMKIKL